MNTTAQINYFVENLPAELQQEVLRYVQRLMKKKTQPKPPKSRRVLRFAEGGDSGGLLNRIENVRDFAYSDLSAEKYIEVQEAQKQYKTD